MNNILTLNDIAAKLAQQDNLSYEEALQAIEALLSQTRESIISGKESVVMPGLGELSVADNDLVFTADSELADTINEPFAFFEPVPYSPEAESESTEEINDEPSADPVSVESENPGGTKKIADAEELSNEPNDAESNQEQIEEEQQESPVATTGVEVELKDSVNDNVHISREESSATEESVAPSIQYLENKASLSDDYRPAQKKGFNPVIAFILGVLTGMIIVCIAVYFLYPNPYEAENYIYEETIEEVNENNGNIILDDVNPNIVPVDTLSNERDSTVNEEPSSNIPTSVNETIVPDASDTNVVTDTVSSTNFLATMARKYYGEMDFWVYIYLENKDKLKNPDQVPAGTIVVIPPASKYNIDANNPESVRKAKALTGEIYAPYR